MTPDHAATASAPSEVVRTIERGGVDDLVLRPRAGAAMPDLPKLAWPEAVLAVLRDAAQT